MKNFGKRLTLICFLVVTSAIFALPLLAASHAPVTIMAVEPPRGPYAPGWAQWVSDIEPHVNGVVIICKWNEMEPSQGVYDFTHCDNAFRNFPSNFKFGIVLQPIGFVSNQSTPAYVYSAAWAQSLGAPQLDYVTCPAHPGSGKTLMNTIGHSGDVSAFPAPWEKPMQVAWHRFLAQAIVHFNSVSWKNQIAYIRPGYSEGGQASDPCESMMIQLTGSLSNLQADWVGGDQALSNFVASQNPTVPFQMAISCSGKGGCTDWADVEAASDIANHIGIGSGGAQYNDIHSEQNGQPASSDWVAMFNKYSAAPVVRELQSLTQTSVVGRMPTGSLADLLPFEANNYATIVEVYLRDLSCSYVPGYSDASGCPSGYAPYQPYQQAIAAAQQ